MSEITETELPTSEEDASEASISRRAEEHEVSDPETHEAAEAGFEAADDNGVEVSAERSDEDHGGQVGDGQSDETSGDPSGDPDGLWPAERLKPVLEAVLFAAADAMQIRRISEIIEGATRPEVVTALEQLRDECQDRGFRLVEVAGGWQFRTAPEHHETVRKLFKEKPHRLTRAQMEVLTIIAYKQPVSRAELEAVRGVDSSSVMEALVERRLVKIAGRRDVPGRPLVYTTTQEFLELFSLKDLKALPALPELGDDIQTMAERSGFSDDSAEREAAVIPLEEGDAGEEVQGRSEAGEAGESAEGDAQDTYDGVEGVEGVEAHQLERQADGYGQGSQDSEDSQGSQGSQGSEVEWIGQSQQGEQDQQDQQGPEGQQDDSLETRSHEDLEDGSDRQDGREGHEESGRPESREAEHADQPGAEHFGSLADQEVEEPGDEAANPAGAGSGREQGH
jgi:segregation and condensation protein B